MIDLEIINIDNEDKDRFLKEITFDPALFCKYVLHFKPFDYQSKVLRDESKRIIVCAGRQIGKSFTVAARAIWFAVTHEKTNTLIVSATLRQSMLMFDKILNFVDDSYEIKSSVTYRSRTRLKFRNGSQIIALPCGRTGHTLRGFTAHQIIFDEAAFIPEEVITEVGLPMLSTTDGIAIMLSTPCDKNHIFFKAFSSPNWSKFHFPSSVNPLVTKDFLDEQRELVGEQRFQQEYLAEFVDDNLAYFPMTLLRPCVHVCDATSNVCNYCDLMKNQNLDGELYGGYDPGGKHDPAAFIVLQRLSDSTFRVVLEKTLLAKDKTDDNLYTRFTVEIADRHKQFKFRKMFVDSTGLGEPIVEHCKALGLPAEGINLSARNKETVLSNLRILFEQKKIMLPANDLNLLSNLNCIEAERTRVGGYSFSHPNGTHDDLAYALALAAHAGTKASGSVGIIKNDRPSADDSYSAFRPPTEY